MSKPIILGSPSKYGKAIPALRDEPIAVKTPTPAISDRAPDRQKRQRNSSGSETARPRSAVRRVADNASSTVDVFMETTGINPDSEGNTYNSTTYNFNKVTNHFQKNIFQYEDSKEEAEKKIRNLEDTIKNLTESFRESQNEDEKRQL